MGWAAGAASFFCVCCLMTLTGDQGDAQHKKSATAAGAELFSLDGVFELKNSLKRNQNRIIFFLIRFVENYFSRNNTVCTMYCTEYSCCTRDKAKTQNMEPHFGFSQIIKQRK